MVKCFTNIFCKLPIVLALIAPALVAAGEKELPQLQITYDVNNLNNIDYIHGTFRLTAPDGTVWDIPNALFRTRGATALNYSMKPSLNLKLTDETGEELDVDLLGLRKASSFILDAMAIDRINMRNRIAFDIWNSFSRLPYDTDFGSRNGTVGAFIEAYINGEYKGIYCLSDKINRKLLDLKKPEVNDATGDVTIRGLLYKNGTNDLDCDQETPGFYNNYIDWVAEPKDVWELHEPEEYASEAVWAPMIELYADDNYKDYDYVKEHFWLDNLADYTIHVMALSIVDNWGNKNKYFSIRNVTKKGEDNSRFIITPWDLDTSFGGSFDGSCYDGDYVAWSVSDVANNAPLPIAACMNQEDFKTLLRDRWIEGSAGAFAVDSVKKRLFETRDLFMESGAWQRTVDRWKGEKYPEMYVDDLQKEIDLIALWYEDRFKEMDEYFGVSDADRARFAEVGTNIADTSCSDSIYNIQGFPVKEMTAPGLYIKGGKKVLVR